MRRKILFLLGCAVILTTALGEAQWIENSDNITVPTNYLNGLYVKGVSVGWAKSVRDFGALDNDATDNSAALQAAVAAVPPGGTLLFPFAHSGIYRLRTRLSITRDRITIQCAPGTILYWTALGAGTFQGFASTVGIQVTGNQFRLQDCTLQGPHVGIFVEDAYLVTMEGANTTNRLVGLTVKDSEFTAVGMGGLITSFVDRILVDHTNFHHIGYFGAMFNSSNDGRVVGSRFATIGPGKSGNQYGLTLTHRTAGYSSDPNAGTKQATNPFCSNWVVESNEADDIDWIGFDTHGCYECIFARNHVYATRQGISVSGSSGSAAGYGGADNQVIDNFITSARKDGSPSGRENTWFGINANGGLTVPSKRIKIMDNIIHGKGIKDNNNGGSIQCVYCEDVDISHNSIYDWAGIGIQINVPEPTTNIRVAFNLLGPIVDVSDTIAMAVSCAACGYMTTGSLTIVYNVLKAMGGTAARIGFYSPILSGLCIVTGNDFVAATVAPLQVHFSCTPS